MNIKRIWAVLAVLMLLAVGVTPVFAQTLLFKVERSEAVITIDEQGLATVEYIYEFVNTPSGAPIDFIDIGMPTNDYRLSNVAATIDGKPISDIEESPYVKPGIALGLGSNAIPAGQRGTVKVTVTGIGDILYKTNKVADVEEDYASFNFSPNSFGSQYMQGSTDLTVALILPPGMIESDPRWFTPQSWPGSEEPSVSYIDDQDRIVYEWNSPNANCYTQYIFGAAFPARLVPSSTLQTAPLVSSGGGSFDLDNLCGPAFCLAFAGFFGVIIYASVVGEKKRRMQYLPPKIAIEGNGVKRGLTAVEAAILMEQPLDKVMTMILFSVVKKGAATVTSREPLKIEVTPAPTTELRSYETEFLAAMQLPTVKEQRKALGEMVTGLVKSIAESMRGFSRKETVAFYQDIMRRAWEQVKAADTPEMKMKRYDEALDWTMLDKDFGDQSREVFSGGPVILPHWWGHYDPTFRPATSGSMGGGPSVSVPTQVGSAPGSSNLPSLPGADFAASVVGGIQNFSGQVLGDVTTFTSGVTNKTNPIPKSTSSSRSYRSGGGGGRSCACACACAGCACACAGGGR